MTSPHTAPYPTCLVLRRHPAHLLQKPLCGGGPPKHLGFLACLAIQCAKNPKAWVCKIELADTPPSLPATPPPGRLYQDCKDSSKGLLCTLVQGQLPERPASPARATGIKVQPLPPHSVGPPPSTPPQASQNASLFATPKLSPPPIAAAPPAPPAAGTLPSYPGPSCGTSNCSPPCPLLHTPSLAEYTARTSTLRSQSS